MGRDAARALTHMHALPAVLQVVIPECMRTLAPTICSSHWVVNVIGGRRCAALLDACLPSWLKFYLAQSHTMERLDAAMKALRRRSRYRQQLTADPFTMQFKTACVHLWRLRPQEQLLGPFANWWQIRFRKSVATITVPAVATVVEWCAAAGDVQPRVDSAGDWNPLEVHATLFLFEWETSLWLITQNAKGIAVPTHMVVEHYLQQLKSIAEPPPWVARVLGPFERPQYHYKWMHWFRSRWGIRWKKIPLSNPMPHDETLRKVGSAIV